MEEQMELMENTELLEAESHEFGETVRLQAEIGDQGIRIDRYLAQRMPAQSRSYLQKLIRDNCTERFRTVLYRRAMLRISEQVARSTGCRALVTGEAVGQVASQTLVNMNTINRAIDMLVLRPLVGADKLETIRIAEMIGSYDLSNTQVPDSCTVFAPSSPATATPEPVAEAEERKIPDYPAVLEKIIADIETIA